MSKSRGVSDRCDTLSKPEQGVHMYIDCAYSSDRNEVRDDRFGCKWS